MKTAKTFCPWIILLLLLSGCDFGLVCVEGDASCANKSGVSDASLGGTLQRLTLHYNWDAGITFPIMMMYFTLKAQDPNGLRRDSRVIEGGKIKDSIEFSFSGATTTFTQPALWATTGTAFTVINSGAIPLRVTYSSKVTNIDVTLKPGESKADILLTGDTPKRLAEYRLMVKIHRR